jgi:hypothetical protein
MAGSFMAGQAVKFEPSISDVQKAFSEIPKRLAAVHIGASLRRASEPLYNALKGTIRQKHKGPTGNLLRAVTIKVKRYTKDGNAVALVGFAATGKKKVPKSAKKEKGKDRAFHQGFLEFGTKPRSTKKNVASSFRSQGEFKIKGQGRGGKGPLRTNPRPPKGFFKKVAKGQKVALGAMKAYKPVSGTYQKQQGSLKGRVEREMVKGLDNAAKDAIGRLAKGIALG